MYQINWYPFIVEYLFLFLCFPHFTYGIKRIVLIQIASIYQKVNLNNIIIRIVFLQAVTGREIFIFQQKRKKQREKWIGQIVEYTRTVCYYETEAKSRTFARILGVVQPISGIIVPLMIKE